MLERCFLLREPVQRLLLRPSEREVLVTSGAVGHIEKPQPRRLSDGRIALSFAIRRAPQVYDLAIAYLAADAPL